MPDKSESTKLPHNVEAGTPVRINVPHSPQHGRSGTVRYDCFGNLVLQVVIDGVPYEFGRSCVELVQNAE